MEVTTPGVASLGEHLNYVLSGTMELAKNSEATRLSMIGIGIAALAAAFPIASLAATALVFEGLTQKGSNFDKFWSNVADQVGRLSAEYHAGGAVTSSAFKSDVYKRLFDSMAAGYDIGRRLTSPLGYMNADMLTLDKRGNIIVNIYGNDTHPYETREAARRGAEEALRRHYSAAGLQKDIGEAR